MNAAITLLPFTPDNAAQVQAATALWNAACGVGLAIQPDAVTYNTRPATGAVQAGRLAVSEGAPCGFVSASALPADRATSPPEIGWIDALVVQPDRQRQGVGQALLAWAEQWLAAQGCTVARLGGSLRPFAPGVPVELNSAAFFRGQGYQPRDASPLVWDMARDLVDYPAGASGVLSAALAGAVHCAPLKADQTEALLVFLRREFPDRWRFEAEEHLRNGGDPGEYLLLWQGDAVVIGCCRLRTGELAAPTPLRSGFGGAAPTPLRSGFGGAFVEPLDRYFLHGLPQPWGQLGSVGVGASCRGKGYGLALIDQGLRRLQAAGVRGCVIDWTHLLNLYGRFGFRTHRSYLVLTKVL